MKKTRTKISIADLGGINLELPMVTLANEGKKKILIINNLHGNEVTGFYILEKLINQLEDLDGVVDIVTTANPLGLMNKHRLMPLDYTDLNRGYPAPSKSRGVHVALKEKLTELALQHDYVLDLHTFVRPSLSAGMAFDQADEEKQKLQDEFLDALDTDIIYEMNTRGKEEKRVASALGPQLTTQGRWVSIVEYPPSTQLTEDDIQRYADGLQNGLAVLNMCKTTSATKRKLDRYKRQQMISRQTGVFVPKMKVGQEVKKGDLLGHIIDTGLRKTDIRSGYEGILGEIAAREFYLYGDKLATIAGK